LEEEALSPNRAITGKQIQRARKILGLTQEDLAKRLDIPGGRVLCVSRWENGHKNPQNSLYRDRLRAFIDAAERAKESC